ncbi:hypothetical protein A6M21_11055 [Desulfotomaculum copahuensis]|uniref:DNA mismatch repair protein MutL n=1 Tax=Desulfotomaculum copahuensis TaxID=1838280 RepID=A0A1B7LE70_9FIRM|nr:hypothetical protein A6M21_11055 [Desulfotomaculum copahuensis]
MSRIVLLDELTANQIAAGEVVERPASVVKELMENALDAGAGVITVEIAGGGLEKITVTDNGCGMEEEDARLAFQRYATSKIHSAADLERVRTFGFRGEALASIAAVSHVLLKTRPAGRVEGIRLELQGGRETACGPAALAPGTGITVSRLFYNTPARRKYMKSPGTEGGLAGDAAGYLAMARPDVSIVFTHNGREVFRTPGNGRIKDALAVVLGISLVREMVPFERRTELAQVEGFAGLPSLHRSSRRQITVFINGRYVHSPLAAAAVQEAYHTLLPAGRFPVAVLYISLDPSLVDVNVHPAKLEIRLFRERELAALITRAVRESLQTGLVIPGTLAGAGEKSCPADSNRQKSPDAPAALEMPPAAGNRAPVEMKRTAEAPADGRDLAVIIPAARLEAKQLRLSLAEPAAFFSAGDAPPAGFAGAGGETAANTAPGRDFPVLQVLGQLPPTYILAAGENGLYVIDQHAAHERVFYEQMMNTMETRGTAAQMLVEPVLLQLSLREEELLAGHKELFDALGFVLEHLSGGAVLVRGLPVEFPDPESYFRDVLAALAVPGRSPSRRDLLHHLAAEAACRAAVKSGARLSVEAMLSLLEQLARTETPFTCPHGRPTVVLISGHELAHRFKRI